jgi:hypothetical protein
VSLAESEFSASLKSRPRSRLQANKNNAMTFGLQGSCYPALSRMPPVFSPANNNQGIWTQHLQNRTDLIAAPIQVNTRLESVQVQTANQIR